MCLPPVKLMPLHWGSVQGLQAAQRSAKGADYLACIEKIEKLHTRARRCSEVLTVLEVGTSLHIAADGRRNDPADAC